MKENMKLQTASRYSIIKKGTYALEPREKKRKMKVHSGHKRTNIENQHTHTHPYTKFLFSFRTFIKHKTNSGSEPASNEALYYRRERRLVAWQSLFGGGRERQPSFHLLTSYA